MRTNKRADAGGDRTSGAADVDAMLDDLARAIGAVRCAGSQRLMQLGISMTHLHVLTLLRHHGPLPMSRVADLLGGSMSGATGIVDRMEERGLVERVRVPDDRRVVLVRPTAAGNDLLNEVEIIRGDLARAVLRRLGPDQLARLAAAIEDVRSAVTAELASAPERYASLHAHEHPDTADDPHNPSSAQAAPDPTAGAARA